MKKLTTLAAISAFALTLFGCATEGPAPRTHAKLIHVGVNSTNGTPELTITDYNNPKDLVIGYDPATQTFSLKSSNNAQVIDSSSAANAAYISAVSALINSAIQTGISASAKAAGKP